jgi:hypothetical protein
MNLKEQLAAKVSEAKTALEKGDLEGGKRLRQEADSIKAAIVEYEALEGMMTKSEPIRPELPGVGSGTMATPEKAAEPKENMAIKAAYQMQFGDADDAIKAILTDLHGRGYEERYWRQRAAFRRYLRGDAKALSRDDEALLREIVMTPSAVKAALAQGVDDIQALKSTMVEASDTLGGWTRQGYTSMALAA